MPEFWPPGFGRRTVLVLLFQISFAQNTDVKKLLPPLYRTGFLAKPCPLKPFAAESWSTKDVILLPAQLRPIR